MIQIVVEERRNFWEVKKQLTSLLLQEPATREITREKLTYVNRRLADLTRRIHAVSDYKERSYKEQR
jgi:hypothetical protein